MLLWFRSAIIGEDIGILKEEFSIFIFVLRRNDDVFNLKQFSSAPIKWYVTYILNHYYLVLQKKKE